MGFAMLLNRLNVDYLPETANTIAQNLHRKRLSVYHLAKHHNNKKIMFTVDLPTLLAINLGILLLLLSAIFLYNTDKAKREKKLLLLKISRLNKQFNALKQQEKQQLKHFQGIDRTDDSELLEKLSASLEANEQQLDELQSLNSITQNQLDEISYNKQAYRQLKVQLSQLQAQTDSRQALLENLKQENKASRYRLIKLDEKIQQQSKDLKNAKSVKINEQNTRRANQLLKAELQSVNETVKQYRQLKQKLAAMTAENNQLTKQLHMLNQQKVDRQISSGSSNMDQHIQEIEKQLQTIEATLNRTLREKQFIEIQFLKLVDEVEAVNDNESDICSSAQ